MTSQVADQPRLFFLGLEAEMVPSVHAACGGFGPIGCAVEASYGFNEILRFCRFGDIFGGVEILVKGVLTKN